MKCEICGGLGMVYGPTGITGRCYCIYGADYQSLKSVDTMSDVMAFSVKHDITYNDSMSVLTMKPSHRKTTDIKWDETDWELAQKYRKIKKEQIEKILNHNT